MKKMLLSAGALVLVNGSFALEAAHLQDSGMLPSMLSLVDQRRSSTTLGDQWFDDCSDGQESLTVTSTESTSCVTKDCNLLRAVKKRDITRVAALLKDPALMVPPCDTPSADGVVFDFEPRCDAALRIAVGKNDAALTALLLMHGAHASTASHHGDKKSQSLLAWVVDNHRSKVGSPSRFGVAALLMAYGASDRDSNFRLKKALSLSMGTFLGMRRFDENQDIYNSIMRELERAAVELVEAGLWHPEAQRSSLLDNAYARVKKRACLKK